MKPIYTLRFRPVSSWTLPNGIVTEWVRLPHYNIHTLRKAYPDLEMSDHPYGEFTTSRDLTDDEIASFQFERTDPGYVLRTLMAGLAERVRTLKAEAEIFDDDDQAVKEIGQLIVDCETEVDATREAIDKLAD